MANRHTLHFKHLDGFKKWLIENDWEIKPLSNSQYEVLRAKRDLEWVIVYKKLDAKEHYSLSDNASKWVNRWLHEMQIRGDERAKVIEKIINSSCHLLQNDGSIVYQIEDKELIQIEQGE